MSDSSDDGAEYECIKCPTRPQFKNKKDFVQHRKEMHPTQKSDRKLHEEEAEEEAWLLSSMISAPRPSNRQNPITVGAPTDHDDGDEAEDFSGRTTEEDAEPSRTGKRGRPAGAKSLSKKGKPAIQSAKGGPKSLRVFFKANPGGKSKAVASWMDEEFITQSRFSGG